MISRQSITSLLSMWRFGNFKAELFSAMYLASIGYKGYKNISPLGGPDDGRDLEDVSGKNFVACYFPTMEQESFSSIRRKYNSDIEKALGKGAQSFVFITGQVLQDRQKKILESYSSDIASKVISGDEIAAHICRPENAHLREELGFFAERPISNDKNFCKSLYNSIDFQSLIEAANSCIPPISFSGYFVQFYDDLARFQETAEPSLLSDALKVKYFSWLDAISLLDEEVFDSEHYFYAAPTRTFNLHRLGDRLEGLPTREFTKISNIKKAAFKDFTDTTLALIHHARDEHGLMVKR
ncbi:hypothetical protein RDI61_20600 [Pseudomonas plecoglossicida]|uniref:hypothetical protein n=1 Tax=Pseudomonas TaxID=286 RepID=UPI0006D3DB7C|nr:MULTISPECIES: hypothetical protein [Pseudomonas]MDQ7966427.1 hypothetical protein [Pseudomonas plecoglossicida]WBM47495.1 hypothetical protein M2J85_04265 [Pseudomonas putida]WFG03994.1 hypothetical protein P3X84_05055 [Pseudomonas putida]